MLQTDLAESIGMVAGTLTTLSFLPQVIKVWRCGSTSDISLAMFLGLCVGVALWLVYGVMLMAWPVILANGATLVLAGLILIKKLRDLRQEKRRPSEEDRP